MAGAQSQLPRIDRLIPDLRWLRENLLQWFSQHGRSYPWRETQDPYAILLAEIMLRRTWANQVVPVYRTFLKEYPDPFSLAHADSKRVESLLWPLGLSWRARDVLGMAYDLRDKFACQVPGTREELKQLTGVGDYIAGAVLSLAFNQPEWIVDTNVVRVFQRFLGLGLTGEIRRHPLIVSLAQEYAHSDSAGKANLALLDHAALVCKPGHPLCSICPLHTRCKFILTEPNC